MDNASLFVLLRDRIMSWQSTLHFISSVEGQETSLFKVAEFLNWWPRNSIILLQSSFVYVSFFYNMQNRPYQKSGTLIDVLFILQICTQNYSIFDGLFPNPHYSRQNYYIWSWKSSFQTAFVSCCRNRKRKRKRDFFPKRGKDGKTKIKNNENLELFFHVTSAVRCEQNRY